MNCALDVYSICEGYKEVVSFLPLSMCGVTLGTIQGTFTPGLIGLDHSP